MAKSKKRRKPTKVEREEEEDKCDLDFDKLSKKDMIKIKSLFERLEEQELLLEQQEEYLIGKIEELKALNEEHGKLKHSHISLIGKHENLEKEYACAGNVSSFVDPLEAENTNLKAQLEVLTSKHVKMQKDSKMLKCSHENLQDAHVMLQVSHEVVIKSVKHFQPHKQECTCLPNFVNSIYANVCFSQSQQSSVEQINMDSCDDLIAEENDLLKLEVQRLESEVVKLKGKTLQQPTQDNRDHMMNKLELRTTITRSSSQQKYKSPHHKKQEKVKDLKHIKCFMCSDIGHYAFMCSTQVKSKTKLSRRQRKQLRTIICFGCKKEGHKIQACPNFQAESHCSGRTGQTGMHNRSDRSSSGLAPQEKEKTSSKGPIASRIRQGPQEASQRQEKKHMSKIRGRICYTCRLKGHLCQDCPKGNKCELKVVNSASYAHDNSNGHYDTRKVMSSPSARAIWVPKILFTNLKGPNETWVPKLA
jgi:hypothetical protein